MSLAVRTLHLLLILAACGHQERPRTGNVKGGRAYGGIFNWNETGPVRSIHPPGLTTAAGFRVGCLVYEGLVRFDPQDLTVRPCLAERWEVDPAGTSYTFHLRPDVRFHDDSLFSGGDGRVLTAEDVEHCFRRLCTADPENNMFWLFQDRVRGANAHFKATREGWDPGPVEGIRAMDERTLHIELIAPDPLFLQVLAHQGCWIYPRELEAARPATTMRAIGTGPFVLRNIGSGGALVFERSPHYWGQDGLGNALPFLDGVRVTFNNDKAAELVSFLQGKLSVVVDPPLERPDVLSDTMDAATGRVRYRVQRIPGLSVQFYGFNTRARPFDQAAVRKAFAMAIDQRFLVDSVLKGSAIVAEHGIVPPGLKDYPQKEVPGLLYDPERARQLLAEAGFPGGKGFPPVRLQVNNDGFGYVRVAEAVQGMLERNLGIGLSISVLPIDQHYALVDEGRALLWRQGWVADYPDPENFLALFHGNNAVLDTAQASPLNTTRYHNARFDSLYQQARTTMDPARRLALLAAAERCMMEDAAVAPLYFDRTVRLLQPWVMDMPMNAMDLRDLSRVWFDPAKRND